MKLQKVLVAIAFSLFAAAAAAAAADPPAAIGRLNHVAGPVSFAPAQAPEDWAAATLNRPITTGDRLWTDSGGRAEMHVGSLAIRMDAQTSLDVLKLDDSGLQLRLAQGSANLRVRRGSDQPVEIATPGGAVVLMRPGSYRVNVDPRGSVTSVTVRGGGQAEVFARNGSFLVSDGQQATVGDSRQDLAGASGPDEFDQWTAKRDQREDRIASTRYVPAEMTGYEDLDEHGTWRTVPQYGAVWQPRAVPAGWAPYRHGHWVWVAPWGWTWVDDAPWGFAPSHYGRWVWLGNHWAWAPGRIVERPVYAPAMVAFIGGSNFSVSVGVGTAPAVAWVPLGWREPYRPWYRASHTHVRNVNVTHVTNVTNITNNVTNVRLVNRNAPSAVTVVSRENFVAARAVQRDALKVSQRTIAAAPVAKGAPVDAPERASLAQARSGARPPAEVRSRETVAVNTPPAPARDVERAERKGKGRDEARVASRDSDDRPRVRVIDRQRRVELQGAQTPASPAAQPQAKAGERAQDKAAPQARGKAPAVEAKDKAAPQPQPQAQGKAPPVEGKGNQRAQEKAASQSQPQAQGKAPSVEAKGTERAQEKAASKPQAAPQAERRVSAPPADVAKRPTFDRETRQVAPQADTKRGERQAGRAERPEQQQAEQRAREQQAREQQAQEQRAREQQAQRQQPERLQQERQRQQQAQERQGRRQAEKPQPEQRQEDRQQRAQPDERAQVQQQAQQRAQEQAQQQQARERAQEQAQQRAQQQAQQQAQQRAQEQARQQQQAQRAQPQAQQQAREQQAQQRAQQQQQQQARQQRRDQPQEKGGRERARQDKDKSEKG